MNHKGVLGKKTLTIGRLLTEISPYATWSSTLPWIVKVELFKLSKLKVEKAEIQLFETLRTAILFRFCQNFNLIYFFQNHCRHPVRFQLMLDSISWRVDTK